MSILDYKNKIVGSIFLLSSLAVVFFVVLEPVDSSKSTQILSGGFAETDTAQKHDPTQPRPELVVASTKTQRLEDTIQNQQSGIKEQNPITQVAGENKSKEQPVQTKVNQVEVAVTQTKPVETFTPEAKTVAVSTANSEPTNTTKKVPTKVAKAKTEPQAKSEDSVGGWFVQLGVFKSYSNAELLEVAVRNVGYATRLDDGVSGQTSVTKLLVGPYSSKTIATAIKTKLESTGFDKKHGIDGMFVIQSDESKT